MSLVIPALIVAALIGAPSVGALQREISPTRAHEIVVEESARNEARAMRAARRQLRLISLPPGAASSRGRPTGVGRLLREPAGVPGGPPHVESHRFWTVPRTRDGVLDWLRRHPPGGTRGGVVVELGGSNGKTLEFESIPGPKHVGYLGGLLLVSVVERSTGGSAVRADSFETWEFPRSPLETIPADSRFLSLEVSPGSGGIHEEGERTRPSRYASTDDRDLVGRLVRIVNRQPAFQASDLPSCGPQGAGSEYRLFTLAFKTSRHGRTLARVSQEVPIGICSAMQLRLAGRRPYALEGGRNVLRAARPLIRSAEPRHR